MFQKCFKFTKQILYGMFVSCKLFLHKIFRMPHIKGLVFPLFVFICLENMILAICRVSMCITIVSGIKSHWVLRMEKSDKCQQKFSIKNKKWKNSKIIGRRQTKKPMPWMTLISVKGSQCGGTLINNQFVLTAASCFCSAAMLCTRMAMDVEKNVPNKIRVSQEQFIKKGNINLK